MSFRESICPRCGAPLSVTQAPPSAGSVASGGDETSSPGICNRCRAEQTPWLECDHRAICVSCPTCNSIRHGSVWSDTACEREDLIHGLVTAALHLHPDLRDVGTEIRTKDTGPNRTSCTIEITATLYGIPVHDTCTVMIVWQGEQCDRCSKLSGGYYATLVQVRASGRATDPYERETARQIADDLELRLQEGGERSSFLSSIEEVHDGLDIVTGSHHLGNEISRAIVRELGGRVTTHPKLVGEKDGKPLYRITCLVRLPYYQKGDVIEIKGSYYEIRESRPKHLRVFDLREGVMKTVRGDETASLVGNVRDVETALVAYVSSGVVGILDPVTYETLEIAPVPWLSPGEGSHVSVLRDWVREQLILIG